MLSVGFDEFLFGLLAHLFGLLGYLLGANRLTDRLVAGVELDARTQLALGAVLAAAITLLTASPGAALVAHSTGLLVGFLAGRRHLLERGGRHGTRRSAAD